MTQLSPEEEAFMAKVVEDGKKYASDELKYKITKKLGKGSYGVVFLGFDEKGVKHAIKICVKLKNDKAAAMEQYFERELALHKQVKNKNIVELYNGLSFPDYTLLDMEFCDMSLEDFVTVQAPGGKKSFRVMLEKEFRPLAKQLTSGIRVLHEAGIVHRDIKLENVMLVKQGDDSNTVFKFTDLGFAKKEMDFMKTALGSPLYEAPEVFHADQYGQYTSRCDMWSLGIMYYRLLTNRIPFRCSSRYELHNALMASTPAAFSLPKDLKVSEACKHFVRNHLVRKPTDRISAVEASQHPYVMPAIHMLTMVSEVKSDELRQALMYDIELGDLYFARAMEKLGNAIQEPHALSKLQESDPIVVKWRDIAAAVNVTDPAVQDDMVVFCDGGVCYKKDDAVVHDKDNDIMTLMVSLKNGVQSEKVVPKEDAVIREEQMKELEAKSLSDNDKVSEMFSLFNQYASVCRHLQNQYLGIRSNLIDMENIRSKVLNPTALWEEARTLLQVVRKKCTTFPNVAFCKPASNPYQQLPSIDQLQAETSLISNQVVQLHATITAKIKMNNMVFGDDLKAISASWEAHKGLQHTLRAQLVGACEKMNMVMQSFKADVEVMLNLKRFIQILEKAKQVDDATSLFPELLPLMKCEYLLVDKSEMAMISQAAGIDSIESVVPLAGKQNSRAEYVASLKMQLENLRKSNEEYSREYDRLVEENKRTAEGIEKNVQFYRAQIAAMRSKLEAQNIPISNAIDMEF